MEIMITVSEKIHQLAAQNGKDIKDYVEEVLEEKFSGAIENETNPNGVAKESRERQHNLLKFAGMFSGGDGKTSENYKKILRDEVNSVAGLTTDKEK